VCVSEDPDRIINTMNMFWAKEQGIVVQCPAGARGFSLPQNVQMGCGTQPFSY
jgi:hypothetical protein